MNEYDEPYNGRRRTPAQRPIEFDDTEFGGTPRGRRDSDWADDLETRADGRLRNRQLQDSDDYYNPRDRYDNRDRYNSRDAYESHDRYDDRDAYANRKPASNREPEMNKPEGFRKRHPVLMNLLYIILTGCMLMWMLMWFLDFWTFHGEERVVPDVKGQTYESAAGNVDISGLNAIISDSVFDSYSRPGTVVEQTPIPGARIKKGGNVYLTIVAFSPKLVTVPDFYNVSARQARSMFEGLGIKEIREVPVTSEYAGLVLGAKFNGVELQPGARIPVSAVVTIEVGSGWEESLETGADIDSLAIDNAIEELNIE